MDRSRLIRLTLIRELKNPVSPLSRQLRQDVGRVLLRIIKEDYRIRATGHPDSTQFAWEPTIRHLADPENEEIMILTGRLLNTLINIPDEKGIRIHSPMDYAEYAFRLRPLVGPDFPSESQIHKLLEACRLCLERFIRKELNLRHVKKHVKLKLIR